MFLVGLGVVVVRLVTVEEVVVEVEVGRTKPTAAAAETPQVEARSANLRVETGQAEEVERRGRLRR